MPASPTPKTWGVNHNQEKSISLLDIQKQETDKSDQEETGSKPTSGGRQSKKTSLSPSPLKASTNSSEPNPWKSSSTSTVQDPHKITATEPAWKSGSSESIGKISNSTDTLRKGTTPENVWKTNEAVPKAVSGESAWKTSNNESVWKTGSTESAILPEDKSKTSKDGPKPQTQQLNMSKNLNEIQKEEAKKHQEAKKAQNDQPPQSPKEKPATKPAQPSKKEQTQAPPNQKKTKEISKTQPLNSKNKEDSRKEGVWNTSAPDAQPFLSLIQIQQQEKLAQLERQQKEKEHGPIKKTVAKPVPQPQAPKVSSGVWKTSSNEVAKSFADILREEELAHQNVRPPPVVQPVESVRTPKKEEKEVVKKTNTIPVDSIWGSKQHTETTSAPSLYEIQQQEEERKKQSSNPLESSGKKPNTQTTQPPSKKSNDEDNEGFWNYKDEEPESTSPRKPAQKPTQTQPNKKPTPQQPNKPPTNKKNIKNPK